MNQQNVLKTAGLLSMGVAAGHAQGVIVELPQLDQTLEVTSDGTLGNPVRNSIAIDLLPDNPLNTPLVVSLQLDGDLLTEDSKTASNFGLSLMLSKLVDDNSGSGNTGLGSSTLLSLLDGGDIASIPLNGGSTAIFSALGRLTPGETKFVAFGFDDGTGETLHGYFGVSYERIEEQSGEITARLTLGDFAYDDDPNATSLQVVPEPASLAALAAGLMLAGGRRRSS